MANAISKTYALIKVFFLLGEGKLIVPSPSLEDSYGQSYLLGVSLSMCFRFLKFYVILNVNV